MTDMRCSCGRRLRWGDWREEYGGPGRATYCPVCQPHKVKQPIAIPVEVEWGEFPPGLALEDLLPDPSEVDANS